MQRCHTSEVYFEAHDALWRAAKHLLFPLAGLLALMELSAGLHITLAIAAGLLLAFVERAKKLKNQPHSQSPLAACWAMGAASPTMHPKWKQPHRNPPRSSTAVAWNTLASRLNNTRSREIPFDCLPVAS